MISRILQKTSAAFLTLSAALLVSQTTNAQLAANTYQFTALSGTYTDITGGTAIANLLADDGLSAAVNIGFTFNYCGTDYTQFKACSNGWVSFNAAVTSNTWTNTTANVTTIKPALMPLFDDLAGWGTGAAASSVVTGTAPNQVCTIEFKNWSWRGSSAAAPMISFQVKLYQTSNLIQFIYRQEATAVNGDGATIGIGDNDATAGYLSLNNTSSAPTASSTAFTTNITTKPATGQIYQFKPLPPIDMKADSILVDPQFCSNASKPASVKISNQGTATINTVDVYWSVDGVLQTPVTYSAAAISNVTTAPNNTATVLLGDVFYPDNTPRVIKAWVYMPNGLADAVNANDTVTASKSPTLTGVVAHITPHDTTICSGNSITLDGGTYPKNPIYVWNNSHVGQTYVVSEPGIYTLKVQNTDGCFDYDTASVAVHPDPLVNSIAIIDNGNRSFTFNVIGAQNITSYTWTFGDGNTISNNGTPGQELHTYDTAGDYIVTLTLRNDCGEVSVTKSVSIKGANPTSIGDVTLLQKEILLFPNPSKSIVTISNASGIKMKTIEVFNLLGQKIAGKENVGSSKAELNVSGIAVGIYNVVIDTDKGRITKKLEIIR